MAAKLPSGAFLCLLAGERPRVRQVIQQQRDALEEMSGLIRQIDDSHIKYRKRAVPRAQFLLPFAGAPGLTALRQ